MNSLRAPFFASTAEKNAGKKKHHYNKACQKGEVLNTTSAYDNTHTNNKLWSFDRTSNSYKYG